MLRRHKPEGAHDALIELDLDVRTRIEDEPLAVERVRRQLEAGLQPGPQAIDLLGPLGRTALEQLVGRILHVLVGLECGACR